MPSTTVSEIGNYSERTANKNFPTDESKFSDDKGHAGVAIYLSKGNEIGDITADFVANGIISDSSPHGGVIYTEIGAEIGNIKGGNFVGNYILTKGKPYGGVIYNMGKIGDIEANFIGNYIQGNGDSAVNAGVICNGKETPGPDSFIGGEIGSIKGYFIGNYVYNKKEGRDSLGGAIINYGHIGEIDGVFIGNFNESQKTANSGVIRNYAQRAGLATIGADSEEFDKDKVVFNGIFIGNYSQGYKGDAFAGVMRNNGNVNGTISGLYIGNFAATEGVEVKDIYDKTGNAVGQYNYIKNLNDENNEPIKGDSGMAYGGVFYNDIKTDVNHAEDKPYLGNINATFIQNYVFSRYGEAFGGVIFNQNSDIEDIHGIFFENYAQSENFRARGGAIYNDTYEVGYASLMNYTGEIQKIGKGDADRALFEANYAQGKMAQGGSIYVANKSTIQDIYADFVGNQAKSVVSINDTYYYYDIQKSGNKDWFDHFTLTPTAEGGALYVAEGATTGSIYGVFEKNIASTSGVGILEDPDSPGVSLNGREKAKGGAIFVEKVGKDKDGNDVANIKKIEANFVRNIAETTGDNHSLSGVSVEAKGGAIFVNNNGMLGDVKGIFEENEARAVGWGNEKTTVQGGAIYVNDSSSIGTIEGAFVGNAAYAKPENEDGVAATTNALAKKDGLNETEQDLVAGVFRAQGGAIYVAQGAHTESIRANFKNNKAESALSGNVEEYVGGGAIYIYDEGYVNNIGHRGGQTSDDKSDPAFFTGNSVVSNGLGTRLTTQRARGGAIYAAMVGAEGHSIRDITAAFTENKVEAYAESEIGKREAQGGAIYLAEGGVIGTITGGFSDNSITVSGGAAKGETDLSAWGGAVYVAENASIESLVSNLDGNVIHTDTHTVKDEDDKDKEISAAIGNKTESLAGGALYVAGGGWVGEWVGDKLMGGIGFAYNKETQKTVSTAVSISGNGLYAGGEGEKLTKQEVRGGAIYVGLDAQGVDAGDVGGICATNISGNVIEAKLGNSTVMESRAAQGGAIYVADKGSVGDIYAIGSEGISGNSISVSGGATYVSDLPDGVEGDLVAQGGAIYVSTEAHAGDILASSISENSVKSTAAGNKQEYVGGGAIYVASAGKVGRINTTGAISGNTVSADGNSDFLTVQRVRGGAILVADKGVAGDIIGYDIVNNKVVANLKSTGYTELSSRIARGGAIFVSDSAEVGKIVATGSKGISGNSITVSGGKAEYVGMLAEAESDLVAQGGAIYVASKAHAGDIYASSISGNSVTSTAEGNRKEYTGGGAIYVASEGYVGDISVLDNENKTAAVSNNKVEAQGKSSYLTEQRARGGAFLISNSDGQHSSVGTIWADFVGNQVIADASEAAKGLQMRYALGGAIYLSYDGKIDNIYGGDKGFSGNSITVSGGSVFSETALRAWGGAIYISDAATINTIIASFDGNIIRTDKHTGEDGTEYTGATGNATESVAGGALYVAGDAEIGEISGESISGNEVHAGGLGAHLSEQAIRGGAIYVGIDGKDQQGGVGKVGDILVGKISNNKVDSKLGDSTDVIWRAAQGGAIYVADTSTIGKVYAREGISGNSITVSGGVNDADHRYDGDLPTNDDEEKTLRVDGDLVAQGGAIYVATKGQITSIFAGEISDNSVTSSAMGNKQEFTGGGAIYVSKQGSVGDITVWDDDEKKIAAVSNNKVEAQGKSIYLTEQRARGGAFLISQNDTGYSVGTILADFVGNQVIADASKDATGLQTRYALGGAIYLSNDGKIKEIVGGDKGFSGNSITVSGGSSDGEANLSAWGGAVYVAGGASIDYISSNFDGNVIRTDEHTVKDENDKDKTIDAATGNKTESLAGGALYVAGNARIDGGIFGNSISGNGLYAGGEGKKLTTQEVRGGAIYVGSDSQGVEGFVGDIYTSNISGNVIEAKLGDSTVMESRAAQGGAIYVADGSEVGNIYATGSKGISGNSITVSGGKAEYVGALAEDESDLVAQGGAIYVASGAHAGYIYANSISDNSVTSTAEGNRKEYIGGGAIYVASEGYVADIYGLDEGRPRAAYVSNNKVEAQGKSSYLTEQRARGGAFLISQSGAEGYSVGDIYADFVGNQVIADASKDATGLQTRYALGGAIYLSNNGRIERIDGIDGKDALFSGNSITVSGGALDGEANLSAWGGAVYVAGGASIGDIRSNFVGNVIRTDEHTGEDGKTIAAATGNKTESLAGGAVYVAGKAKIDVYIAGDSISGNGLYAGGEGKKLTTQEVRGGAIYVGSDSLGAGTVGAIDADVISGNVIEAKLGDSTVIGSRVAQGGAIYVADGSEVGAIYGYDHANHKGGIIGNSITVSGGGATYTGDLPDGVDADLVAQGGAIYVAKGAHAGMILADTIKGNSVTSQAEGNKQEYVGGGAIYVADGGYLSSIHVDGGAFQENKAIAYGASASLTEQRVRGGAILASQRGTVGYSMEYIIADFVGNQVIADASAKATELQTRYALGGAIYLSNEGKIEEIDGRDKGFSGNSITVSGGSSDGEANLSAWGGAVYVAGGASIDIIWSNFDGNVIRTDKHTGEDGKTIAAATGNKTESLAGGALYVAGGGKVSGGIGIFGYSISISDNGLYAGGEGERLTTQEVRGGAIYVGSDSQGAVGNVGDIYTSNISGNVIEAKLGDSTVMESRVAQGGAIYVADGSEVGNIYAIGSEGISGNSITVSGGSATYAGDLDGDLVAQGGAIYVSKGAHTGNILGSFTKNSVTSTAAGNKQEYVGGGAIYVADGGYVGDVGGRYDEDQDKYYVASISENKVEAGGASASLKEQRARGGAVLVAQKGTEAYSVQDIIADFEKNAIVANASEKTTELTSRIARGGALFLSDQGVMGEIISYEGFVDNSITVSGGYENGNVELLAQGGALYVADLASVEQIQANFTGNEIHTDKHTLKDEEGNTIKDENGKDKTILAATGNKSETVAGGAIYVDAGGLIGKRDADGTLTGGIGTEDVRVSIGQNWLFAGGMGSNLKTQKVQGGAIYVASGEVNGDLAFGTIGTLYASVNDNHIRANAGDSQALEERFAQGGSIYLANYGHIDYIYPGVKGDDEGSDGFHDNDIVVSGGSVDGSIRLNAQGGALYMAQSAGAKGIMAGFRKNKVDTSAATGNSEEIVAGGAIYLAEGAKIEGIGTADADGRVDITQNTLKAGGNSKGGLNLKKQVVQGGAIYVSAVSEKPMVLASGQNSIGEIYADFHENTIVADLSTAVSKDLEQRTVQGGAIYVAGNASVDKIYAKDKGFYDNTITVQGGNAENNATLDAQGGAIYLSDDSRINGVQADFTGNGITAEAKGYEEAKVQGGAIYVSKEGELGNITGNFERNWAKSTIGSGAVELTHGGAIDVYEGGSIGDITGHFIGNVVENSGEKHTEDDGSDKHAKGGAIYLAKDSRIGAIDSYFEGNKAIGSGQVRAGALFVSDAFVKDIKGDFVENQAIATTANNVLTHGGAVRFDESTIYSLESNFIRNKSEGYGGALSLTAKGLIYEVRGDFKGNEAYLKGGAVENLGNIGLRGRVMLVEGDILSGGKMEDNYSNVLGYDEGELVLQRDATDRKNPDGNRQGRWEFDGSFTGGFINSSFFYNTIEQDARGTGAGIYTDKDLFITVTGYKETIMSGNHVRYKQEDGAYNIVRSAIYVDNDGYEPASGEASTIVIYMVAKDNGILRIDDNIRSASGDTQHEGFTLRLRGYTANTGALDTPISPHFDTSGLIVLNNRVEKSYTIMDDVTLYVGYRIHTYQDAEYLSMYNSENGTRKPEWDKHIQNGVYVVGDEKDAEGNWNDIIHPDKGKSTYLNMAGTTMVDPNAGTLTVGQFYDGTLETVERAELFHQSDVFRDSHLSVRSGTVSLTETTYGNRISSGNYGAGTEMASETEEVYTEYLFGSLIAYGADYNYSDYGTNDATVQDFYSGSGMAKPEDDSRHYEGEGGLFAQFEFGISFNEKDLYGLELKDKIYYADQNGNATEERYWYDTKGERYEREAYMQDGKEVHVKRLMAKSDMLTVFAVGSEGADGQLTLDWSQTSKGRVTLNGITVQNAVDGWRYTNKSVSGAQPQEGLTNGDGFNRDLYVQLINYVLLDENRQAITGKTEAERKLMEQFYAMFDEEEEDGSLKGGYHLLRLSDHFDLVHNATAYMRGSQVLADEIELSTTVTKDDSIRVVNWRDHLAEWAEHKGTWDGESTELVKDENGQDVLVKKESGELGGKKHFLLDQSVYYLNRNINLVPNPTVANHGATGDQMWGQYLTIEGEKRANVLDLQRMNMLSLIIPDQQVRLQSFSLKNVKDDHMQNEGDLIFDTMVALDKTLTVNNAGNGKLEGQTLNNQMTVTGITDIDFKITTEGEVVRTHETKKTSYGEKLSYTETKQHGELYINHTTQVTEPAVTTDGERSVVEDKLLEASITHITGTVEHQNITHQGDDELKLHYEDVVYNDPEGQKTVGTWSIETGKITGDVRESFTTNTYLNTTVDGDPKLDGYHVKATEQFKAFQDNSLVMEGGAFNLGTMYKHRLQLRDFAVNGGGVFVNHSTIDLGAEVMGGIDARNATYRGDERAEAEAAGRGDEVAKSASGSGDGLIWLDGFKIDNTSEKMIVHVKFVDDGVGNAVKDGMGIANGAEESGMRIMADGKGQYNWEVTYNDKEAINKEEHPDWVGIRGMYTFRRRGFTPESQSAPVTDVTGSYVSMMQVYNYSFQHADLYADSVYDAQRERLYDRDYTAIIPVKGGKNAVPQASPRPCTNKTALKSGLWFNTYSSTEEMPLHNGPKVRLNMYGGLIGGDTELSEHRNGWSSVWSFYGGYMGSTEHYDGVRIRQNGAAVGATGTFYKKNFYTALTASVGASRATSTGRGGSENFDMFMGGIASRSGFNYKLDGGRYILQPSVQLSYTMFNTFDYTNSFGSQIDSKPTGVFQVHPFVKLIMNQNCTWKPYGTVGVVYNVFSDTKYKINGTDLPSMSIDPYAEYSVGVQRSWSDSYTIFGQATGRSGGRNGVEFNIGIRRAW